ncbi:MAG: phosphoribosylanthranilate isomerase [Candidatus Aenigmarchaeota archaeon]|nr:phosphoribosylanthranilate isomerase [Candidatus Aenigmarchaeota archaeon]
MTKIKICGMTNKEDAKKAVDFGADALGFIFYEKSPRHISVEKAKQIIKILPPFVAKIGVFVDEDEKKVRQIQSYCGLTALQFHGNETIEYCSGFRNVIKSICVAERLSVEQTKKYEHCVCAFLFDTYSANKKGGTGQAFDWNLLKEIKTKKPVILAGGIKAENVDMAISTVKPYAIDSASSTESEPGKKDYDKMKKLIDIVKG